MGQELDCRVHYQKRWLTGRAYLETEYLLFRGEERLKIGLKGLKSVSADAGILKVHFEGGPAEFELGKSAEKWAQKILHPPSRLDKLGVKPGSLVRLVGELETAFLTELEQRGAEITEGRARVDNVFYAAEHNRDLERLEKLALGMKPEGGLWVVYPKGKKEIREIEVLQAGRNAGLKDNKVAAFSATHTALRFVIPLSDR